MSPFGKLPTLEIDGKVYSDSRAICRFLAPEAGLSGENHLENFYIDQIDGAVGDLVGGRKGMFIENMFLSFI